jgi:hypothetical protein
MKDYKSMVEPKSKKTHYLERFVHYLASLENIEQKRLISIHF